MADRVKLTEAQRSALTRIAQQRPTAGNDDGWTLPNARRPTIRALKALGLIERRGSGVECGIDYHRITPAGRALLASDAGKGR